MAGEGVECSWAAAKGFYRRLPLSEKRSCLDSELVLTMARQRMFSRRAREHMVACKAMDNLEDEDGDTNEEKNGGQRRNPLMTACLIEKIVKLCKTHRSATDFDCGFVSAIVNTMKGIKMTWRAVMWRVFEINNRNSNGVILCHHSLSSLTSFD
jgi:hypothetical protein